ncbi:DUF2262 domain-containing protein [Lujinxingia sediminis]|uniref:DUF2262 domain-containing protein n=1 Tax=Lujinxingia sediminis TaxID=2480984 RepID=A0ABY0CNY5_9DELT|nr:DUF2262 domain-containing protein [Lujinxingia sediminis]RVU40973.1 DUF2262 domain-containing protein [Lujinxingia sediminis]
MMVELASIREIVGLVGLRGVGGYRVPPDDTWSVDFSLDWWRDPSGELRKEPLKVTIKVKSHSEVQSVQSVIRSCHIYRFRVRLADDGSRAELVEPEGTPVEDEVLFQRAEELKQPVTVENDVFGTLTFDSVLGWYEVRYVWNAKDIVLYLSTEHEEGLEELLDAVTTFGARQAQWDRRVRKYAASQLLELRNTVWRHDDEDVLSEDEFMRSMIPEAITMYPGGRFEMSFDDGGGVLGHLIMVGGCLDGAFEYADICG